MYRTQLPQGCKGSRFHVVMLEYSNAVAVRVA